MEKITMTKAEAVAKYGSEGCKRHFEKNKKFKNKSIEDALKKTMETFYEEVKLVKVGRKYVFELYGKKNEVTKKVDKRIRNGIGTDSYTRNLDILVAAVLEKESITYKPQVLNKWLFDFGVINSSLYDLIVAKYDEEELATQVHTLVKSKKINFSQKRIVIDFMIFTQTLQSQIAATFNRMEKIGLIEVTQIPMGVCNRQYQLNIFCSFTLDTFLLFKNFLLMFQSMAFIVHMDDLYSV